MTDNELRAVASNDQAWTQETDWYVQALAKEVPRIRTTIGCYAKTGNWQVCDVLSDPEKAQVLLLAELALRELHMRAFQKLSEQDQA